LTLKRLLPSPGEIDSVTPEEQSWVIASEFGICTGWRLNFVTDINGLYRDSGGSSDGISNRLDRLLLGKFRSQSDIIVTTGETARRERLSSSKHAPIAVITKTADLDGVPAIQGSQFFTPIILVPKGSESLAESKLDDVDVRIVPFDHSQHSNWPSEVKRVVAQLGFQSPILEGGPRVSAEFIEQAVIDEICLTITKKPNEQFSARQLSVAFVNQLFKIETNFVLDGLFVETNNLFTRWLRA